MRTGQKGAVHRVPSQASRGCADDAATISVASAALTATPSAALPAHLATADTPLATAFANAVAAAAAVTVARVGGISSTRHGCAIGWICGTGYARAIHTIPLRITDAAIDATEAARCEYCEFLCEERGRRRGPKQKRQRALRGRLRVCIGLSAWRCL